mgnify:CR=1 FL=1
MHGLLAVLSCKYHWKHGKKHNTNHTMCQCCCCCPFYTADVLYSSSSKFGSSAKDAATALKDTAALKGAASPLPSTTSIAAGLSAAVRCEASNCRDPAIATPKDKVQDRLAGEQRRCGAGMYCSRYLAYSCRQHIQAQTTVGCVAAAADTNTSCCSLHWAPATNFRCWRVPWHAVGGNPTMCRPCCPGH